MLLVVPGQDEQPWPTLGPQVCDLLEDRAVYGPGSLQGQPYEIDPEFRAFLYRAYEIYPKGHPWEGRRRFKRVGLSVRKGLAKTEKLALIVFAELHPEGPTRFDGWDASGEPVGRPVRAPYVPMLAVTTEQVEELGYGALKYVVENGPDADLFDSSLERIIRLDDLGHEDGKAVPLANSPGARDGARTTLNAFDEPHRLYLPRQLDAHTTMDANLPKRPLDDPWSLYVGTAGELGQGSVAEQVHEEALAIQRGEIDRPDLLYLYRTDDGGHDLTDKQARIKAVAEATGPAGEWGPGQFDEIASKWDRPGADGAYLERVWLNRWVKSGAQAFDIKRWTESLGTDQVIPDGARVTVGFDGARFRDATGLVVTDIATGVQRCYGSWQQPYDAPDDWEIDEAEVTAAAQEIASTYKVLRAYADPPHWTETVGSWAGRWGAWEEWWTNRPKPMAYAVRAYREAIDAGSVLHEQGRNSVEEGRFDQHVAAAGRRLLNLYDDEGQRLFVLRKIHEDRKFDIAMAAVLSWQARLDAIAAGAGKPRQQKVYKVRRIR